MVLAFKRRRNSAPHRVGGSSPFHLSCSLVILSLSSRSMTIKDSTTWRKLGRRRCCGIHANLFGAQEAECIFLPLRTNYLVGLSGGREDAKAESFDLWE